MAIAYGPIGRAGHWAVEVDGKIAKMFSGPGAARRSASWARAQALSRGKRELLETVFPAHRFPADVAAPAPAPTPHTAPSPPASWMGTVKALEAALAAGELDDQLDALEAGEKASTSPRKTALQAIADRRAQIAG